jgi:hypothetical protein
VAANSKKQQHAVGLPREKYCRISLPHNQPIMSNTPPVLVVCSHNQFMTQNSHNSRTSNSCGDTVTPQHLKWGQESHKSCQITKGQDLAKKLAFLQGHCRFSSRSSNCSWFMDDTNLVWIFNVDHSVERYSPTISGNPLRILLFNA